MSDDSKDSGHPASLPTSCSRVYSLPDSDLIEAYRLIWNLRGKLAAGDCCWNIARAALAVLIEAEIMKNDESH